MWRRLSLRARILILLLALVVTTLAGGLVTMWYTEAIDSLFASLIDKKVASYHAAQELEAALLRQKGFSTYYFLDGDPDWLRQMEEANQSFNNWLQAAHKSSYTEAMGEIINEIEGNYRKYLEGRAQVIKLYQEGDREAGARLHWDVRRQFVALLNLCQRYKLIHEISISRARIESQARARFINTFALIAMPAAALFSLCLAYILIRQILQPIRRMAIETVPTRTGDPPPDEVSALSRGVQSLMANVDQAQSELERSQEHLLQSGKWAMVGKLAASVAHSIRNPLTSVNMRLFSLKRSLQMSLSQKEDFEVISEEIRHIDAIVRNFLEFSRPPKLKMQRVSPSDVVDMALQLLRYRLESYGVTVNLIREKHLPEIWADPDQLKEVLANLMINACESMVGGGRITIREEEALAEGREGGAVVRVSDTGPGIPPAIREKVFQPFYSTKEEGTGLGLSIAHRIIEDHGGSLTVSAEEGAGATFTITLPFREPRV